MGSVVKLAPGMHQPLPAAALEQHIGILGKTGSGKSNAAKVVVEQLARRGDRFVAIDPTGTWYGLRLNAAGTGPSDLRPVIFGGTHADIAIEPQHGAAIAEAVGTASDSAIIDMRGMTVGDRTRFFRDFAEALLRTNRGTLYVVVDEAHLFAPKGRVNDPQSGALLSATNNLISLGRGIGLRFILISQRPAKLHNDALSSIETLVAMRLLLPHDRDAIIAWVKEWADVAKGKEIAGSLGSLGQGDAWVWSPQIDMLERVHFPLASTFDTGSIRADVVTAALAPIDVDVVGARLQKIRADALANDPKTLKRRIAELEREKAKPASAEVDEAATGAAWTEGYAKGVEVGFKSGLDAGTAAERKRLGGIVLEFAGQFTLALDQSPEVSPSAPWLAVVQPVRKEARPQPAIMPKGDIGAERRPLALLAGVYPGGYTEAQWASLAGYRRTGGTWGTYKSRLRTAGRIEERAGMWYATEAGLADVGEIPTLPAPGPQLVEFWASKISGVSKMLGVLRDEYPHVISRGDLAQKLEMAATGGTFGTYLSRLRSNDLVEETGGGIRLAAAIMGD